jgi:hydroxymethylglutaryl-CoA reductase
MCPHDEGYNGPGRRLEGGQVQGPSASEGTGQGLRKAILINEHFVVYGVPAIAVPVFLPIEVQVSVRRGSGLRVLVHPATGEVTWHAEDTDRFEAIRRVMKAMDLSETKQMTQIQCVDDLSGWSGLGSSAGFCVALARALCKALDRSCTDEEINRIAYEGEKVFAANPSGIDNTVATYGKPLWFERGRTPAWEWIRVGFPLWIVIGNSEMPSRTRDEVERVARFREARPGLFSDLIQEATKLGRDVRLALESGDGEGLGALMNKGHAMLQRVGVSNERLDEMVTFCRLQGALGAKLTGGGGGGCMLALVCDAPSGEAMVSGLEQLGYPAICVQLAAVGERP